MSDNNDAMKELLTSINTLQNIISNAGLSLAPFHLPQIAVVGGQSTGKSSVLESFVGRDFLPRGSEIVTRCPLIIQLIYEKNVLEEYAEFSHLPNKRFTNFDEVKAEIENRTNHLTGNKDKIVTDKPINLTIYSPNVVNLTLVDLPGLTKVAVKGQPENIGDDIRKLVLSYIEDKNTLILAISAANNDLATSDGLQLAQQVDKEGDRTYGVLTKLDRMEEGTDARNILLNKVYKLKRGFIGVVNRNTQDTIAKKNIKEAQIKEMEFIQNHVAYRDLAARMGSKYLQNYLSQGLSEHILNRLPELKANLKQKKDEAAELLKEFEDFDEADPMTKLNTLINSFAQIVKTDINGCNDGNVSATNFSSGVKLLHCFSNEFAEILKEGEATMTLEEMMTIKVNLQGCRYAYSVPETLFDKCIEQRTVCYRKLCNLCLTKVEEILQECLSKALTRLDSYPKLQELIRQAYHTQMSKYGKKTKADLHTLIDCQGSFFNQKHPDFKLITSIEDSFIDEEDDEENDEVDGKKISKFNDDFQDYSVDEENDEVAGIKISKFNDDFQDYFVDEENDEVDGKKISKFNEIELLGSEIVPNKELMKNDVIIKQDGNAAKTYKLLLTTYYLAFYAKETNSGAEKNPNIPLEYLEIIDTGRVNEFQIISKARALPIGGTNITILCKDHYSKKEWIDSFQQAKVKITETVGTDEADLGRLRTRNQVPIATKRLGEEDSAKISRSRNQSQAESVSSQKDYNNQIMDKLKNDSSLIRDLQIVAANVNSYMSIIHKIIVDCVTKFIKHLLVDQLVFYVSSGLINDIRDPPNLDELVAVSGDEARRRTEILQTYEATKKALDSLNNFPNVLKFQKLQQ